MQEPTVPASHRDLLRADVAVLATHGPDGRPQVTALWFVADDDDTVHLSLNSSRQKTENLRTDPAVTFFVLDLANPMRYLEIRADAEVQPDEGGALVSRVEAKYGVDVRQMDEPGEERLAVTLRPVKVNAVDLTA
jgi:PPOX class probable F420-dependent enzyme